MSYPHDNTEAQVVAMDKETGEQIDTHRYPMMLPSRGKGERLEEAIHQMIGDEGTEGYLVLWRAK